MKLGDDFLEYIVLWDNKRHKACNRNIEANTSHIGTQSTHRQFRLERTKPNAQRRHHKNDKKIVGMDRYAVRFKFEFHFECRSSGGSIVHFFLSSMS